MQMCNYFLALGLKDAARSSKFLVSSSEENDISIFLENAIENVQNKIKFRMGDVM